MEPLSGPILGVILLALLFGILLGFVVGRRVTRRAPPRRPKDAAARARLAEAGVAFDPIFVTDTGDHLAYFNDPAGNRAQLVGRVTPLE